MIYATLSSTTFLWANNQLVVNKTKPKITQTTKNIENSTHSQYSQTQKRLKKKKVIRILRMGRKKGKVEFDEFPPDNFDPENRYKDPVVYLEMREHIVREKWIQIEKAKIIREQLRWCYRIEGVNHLQKCRHLVTQYLESTRGIGWGKDGRHPSLHGPKVEAVESE
ncbi:putative complex I subunit NDUFS6 protein [Lupinus albus]|uniref:Putative complex I subunit NDUFS6 protein n=1 Tax=Lupinus albus TaxID=3870 RepID=A0A6A4NHA9_LUPAL|nr:putative complex I subunit NDUFS6 protein [Lupinus albus]